MLPLLIVFDSKSDALAFENILQFLDVRVQIMEQKLHNYYIKIGNEEYEIDSNGRVINYPKGLFDTMDKSLDKLIRL